MTAMRPELKASPIDVFLGTERVSATPRLLSRSSPATPSGPSASSHAVGPTLALAELQSWFETIVTHPSEISAAIEEVGSAPLHVRPSAQLDPAQCLAIYHHAYRARLVECLVDDYPALQYALGEDDFERLAIIYVTAHPSRSSNLNGFGANMERFCRARGHSFLADLAQLEWALVQVLHAEESLPLDEAQLSRLSQSQWADARLEPSRTLRLCGFDFPINSFYQAFKHDQKPAIPAAEREHVAIYRQGSTLWRMRLTEPMAELLADLMEELPLGLAVSRLEERLSNQGRMDGAPEDVSDWFQAWVRAGFFRLVREPGH